MDDLSAIEAARDRIAAAQAIIDAELVERDRSIAAARRDGYPWNRISAAAGLSRQAAEAAARRGNGGPLPIPRQRG